MPDPIATAFLRSLKRRGRAKTITDIVGDVKSKYPNIKVTVGQGRVHAKRGLDHTNAADFAIDPDSSEGREIIGSLESQGIPYVASDGTESWSTGPHVHGGDVSQRASQYIAPGTTRDRLYQIAEQVEEPADPIEAAFQRSIRRRASTPPKPSAPAPSLLPLQDDLKGLYAKLISGQTVTPQTTITSERAPKKVQMQAPQPAATLSAPPITPNETGQVIKLDDGESVPPKEEPYVEKLDSEPAFTPEQFNQAETARLQQQAPAKPQRLPDVRQMALPYTQRSAQPVPAEDAPQARQLRIGARNLQDLTGARLTQAVVATFNPDDREAANYLFSLVPRDEQNDIWTDSASISPTQVDGRHTGYAATVSIPLWFEKGIEAYKQGGPAAAVKAIRERQAAEQSFTADEMERQADLQRELERTRKGLATGEKPIAVADNLLSPIQQFAGKFGSGALGIAGATAGAAGLNSLDRFLTQASQESYAGTANRQRSVEENNQRADLSPVTVGLAQGVGSLPVFAAKVMAPGAGALSELVENANQPLDQALGHAFRSEMTGLGIQALQAAGLAEYFAGLGQPALQVAARSVEGAVANTLLSSPELLATYQKARTPEERKALLAELVTTVVVGALQSNLPRALGGGGLPERAPKVSPLEQAMRDPQVIAAQNAVNQVRTQIADLQAKQVKNQQQMQAGYMPPYKDVEAQLQQMAAAHDQATANFNALLQTKTAALQKPPSLWQALTQLPEGETPANLSTDSLGKILFNELFQRKTRTVTTDATEAAAAPTELARQADFTEARLDDYLKSIETTGTKPLPPDATLDQAKAAYQQAVQQFGADSPAAASVYEHIRKLSPNALIEQGKEAFYKLPEAERLLNRLGNEVGTPKGLKEVDGLIRKAKIQGVTAEDIAADFLSPEKTATDDLHAEWKRQGLPTPGTLRGNGYKAIQGGESGKPEAPKRVIDFETGPKASSMPETPLSAAPTAKSAELKLDTDLRAKLKNPRWKPFNLESGGRDSARIASREINLPSKPKPTFTTESTATRATVPLEKIWLGEKSLNREKLLAASENLKQGFKETSNDPIILARDPKNPEQFITLAGDHRIAALKLMDYNGNLPVILRESRIEAKPAGSLFGETISRDPEYIAQQQRANEKEADARWQQRAEGTANRPMSEQERRENVSPIALIRRELGTINPGILMGEGKHLREGGIHGLLSKKAKASINDARELLRDSDYRMPDGRSFDDAFDDEVLSFLEEHGTTARPESMADFNAERKLAAEEEAHYRTKEAQANDPSRNERTDLDGEDAPNEPVSQDRTANRAETRAEPETRTEATEATRTTDREAPRAELGRDTTSEVRASDEQPDAEALTRTAPTDEELDQMARANEGPKPEEGQQHFLPKAEAKAEPAPQLSEANLVERRYLQELMAARAARIGNRQENVGKFGKLRSLAEKALISKSGENLAPLARHPEWAKHLDITPDASPQQILDAVAQDLVNDPKIIRASQMSPDHWQQLLATKAGNWSENLKETVAATLAASDLFNARKDEFLADPKVQALLEAPIPPRAQAVRIRDLHQLAERYNGDYEATNITRHWIETTLKLRQRSLAESRRGSDAAGIDAPNEQRAENRARTPETDGGAEPAAQGDFAEAPSAEPHGSRDNPERREPQPSLARDQQSDQQVAPPSLSEQINQTAHEAATSPRNNLAEPTEAQKEAGNYRKAHINVHGLDISIENPAGSTRSGVSSNGEPWAITMENHYGYIRSVDGEFGIKGADKEHLDVYIGDHPESAKVFVVDQIDKDTGKFDEHKVILGATDQAGAEKLYDAHFNDGKGPDRRGAITEMDMPVFKDWLKNGNTKSPVRFENSAPINEAEAARLTTRLLDGTTKPGYLEKLISEGKDVATNQEALRRHEETKANRISAPDIDPDAPGAMKPGETLLRAAQEARQRIKETLSGTQANDITQVVADLTTLAAHHLYEGGKAFGKWATEMIQAFGAKVRRALRPAWEQAQNNLASMMKSDYAGRQGEFTYERRTDAEPKADQLSQAIRRDFREGDDDTLSSTDGKMAVGQRGDRKPLRGRVGRGVGSPAGGSGVRTTGLGITAQLARTGRIDLRGQSVQSAHDIAQLAQVYRDPRIETFRIIYTKGGQIVAHEGTTSRMPDSAAPFATENTTRGFAEMKRRMQRLGADGYYLLHNHPSGRPKASRADLLNTQRFAETVPGFKGHVIINSGEYAVIDPTLRAPQYHSIPNHQEILLTPSVPHDLLSQPIQTPADAMRLGKTLQAKEGFVTLVYLGADNRVRAIQEMPAALFQRAQEASDYLRGRQRAFGATRIISHATDNALLLEPARALIRAGAIYDHLDQRGRSERPAGLPEVRTKAKGLRVEEDAPSDDQGSIAKAVMKAGQYVSKKIGGEVLRDRIYTTSEYSEKVPLPAGFDVRKWATATREAKAKASLAPADINYVGRLVTQAMDAISQRDGGRFAEINEKLNHLLRPRALKPVSMLGDAQRSLSAGGEFSFLFRQGRKLALAEPRTWRKAAPEIVKGTFPYRRKDTQGNKIGKPIFNDAAKQRYFNTLAEIKADPKWSVAEKAGLDVAAIGETEFTAAMHTHEENTSTGIARQIPVLKQTERGNKAFMAKLVFNAFKARVERAGLNHVTASDIANKTPDGMKVRRLAKDLNVLSGRADIPEKARAFINVTSPVAFALRWGISNFQTIMRYNPLQLARYLGAAPAKRGKLSNLNPQRLLPERDQVSMQRANDAAKMALWNLGIVAAIGGVTRLGAPVSVEWQDPDSPDFLKMKWGKQRYDLGMVGNTLRYVLRMAKRGMETWQGDEKAPGKVFDQTGQFLRQKESPLVSLAHDQLYTRYKGDPVEDIDTGKKIQVGQNAIGEIKTVGESVLERAYPITWQQVVNAVLDGKTEDIVPALAEAIGEGAQSYESRMERISPNTKTMLTRDYSSSKGYEPDAHFTRRVERARALYETYFPRLQNAPQYQRADEEQKVKIETALTNKIKDLSYESNAKIDLDTLLKKAASSEKAVETKEKKGLKRRALQQW